VSEDKIAIELHKLGHSYRPQEWIFQGYQAAVKRGSIFALLGPNGCGKTTLLKIVLGTLKPTAGTVNVYGKIAFVPQLFQVTFDYTVLDMVLMGRARKIGLFSQPSAQDEAAALASLDRFGMADFAERSFLELSGGERQLVIFARALATEADILILDEPTSALDIKNQILVLSWITRLSRQDNLTIVMTTHQPHHALAVAEEVLLMLGEDRYTLGLAHEVLTEENLHSLYDVDMKLIPFEYKGKAYQTLVPVLPDTRNSREHHIDVTK
jgi:iron complex transport system ATP-binding protein